MKVKNHNFDELLDSHVLQTIHLVCIYSKLEEKKEEKTQEIQRKKKNEQTLLCNELLSFIMSATIKEIHNSFMFFLEIFNKKNFKFSKQEFTKILNNLAAFPNLGEKKVKLALKKTLLKSKFANIAELFSEGQRENFSVYLIDKLFDLFKTDYPVVMNNNSPSEYIIDINKFLPILLSFFLENYKIEIQNRWNELESIKGRECSAKLGQVRADYILLERNLQKNSLKSMFESLGCTDFNESIGFNKIEEILVSFRHAVKSRFTEEQVELILNEFKSIMQVEPFSKTEKKKISIKKAINLLSLKICLHSSCYQIKKQRNLKNDKHIYMAENLLWNCANYSPKLEEQHLKEKMIIYIEKTNFANFSNDFEHHLYAFYKKKIPLLTKESFKNMMEDYNFTSKFDLFQSSQSDFTKDLTSHLYPLLQNGAKFKLRKYIEGLLTKIDPESSQRKNPKQNITNIELIEKKSQFYSIPPKEINKSPPEETRSLSNRKSKSKKNLILDEKKASIIQKFFQKYAIFKHKKPKPPNSAANVSITSEYQNSDDIIKSVLFDEKINSLFDLSNNESPLDSLCPQKKQINRRNTKIPSYESIPNERNLASLSSLPEIPYFMHPKSQTIENLSEISEENNKEEEKIVSEEEKEEIIDFEDSEHYLRSAFSKEDVFSTSLDFSEKFERSGELNLKEWNKKSSLRENSFKNRLDVDTFLGKKFKERGGKELRIREGFCYENFECFQEAKNRCPCYSNCILF